MSKPDLYECDECGFGFDARHTDMDGGWTCPVCENDRLSDEITRLRAENERLLDHTLRVVTAAPGNGTDHVVRPKEPK